MEKLPEKWCIRLHEIDTFNHKINRDHPVIKYLNEKYNNKHDGTNYYYADLGEDSTHSNRNNWGIPEITLDEFKRLVLKQQITYEIY